MSIPRLEKKHICWNITSRCNANCLFCFRNDHIKELSVYQNSIILENLMCGGIQQVAWTGGEALLYDGLVELLKQAYDGGIISGVITNGKALTPEKMEQIIPFIDSVGISLDSTKASTNLEIGRGCEQYEQVSSVVSHIRNCFPNTIIQLNTLVSKLNISDIQDIIPFLVKNRINYWKLFRFSALRGMAITNSNLFAISDYEFSEFQKTINSELNKSQFESNRVDIVDTQGFENDYYLIQPNGELVATRNGKDVVLGNLLKQNIQYLLKMDGYSV